jgi:RNA polymerase sigma-70 factor, ECF subfamily
MVQLTFIRAYQRLADFRPGEEFGIWLCVTCKYLILTELEKKQRETSHLSNYREQLGVEIATVAATDNEPDMRTEQLAKLRACVDKLGQETAELVTLRYFNKRSCKEIAEQKQRTVTWVTTTLSRTRKTLRACLERSPQSGSPS